MSLRECHCPRPERHVKPGREHTCVKCGGVLSEEWTSNDETISDFYDRVSDGMFPGGAPDWFQTFRLHCEQREKRGRRTFGESYLARDNAREATEELADCGNYVFFKTLQEIRAGGDPQYDLALSAAYHAAMAYRYTQMMNAKEAGKP